jgi:hypothetical protein
MPFGTDIHALIHAVEEGFLTLLVVNAYAQQVTGMEDHALFVQILKFGAVLDYPVFVLLATGMD